MRVILSFQICYKKKGCPKNIAIEDACRIEHVISQETFEAIKKYYQNNKN